MGYILASIFMAVALVIRLLRGLDCTFLCFAIGAIWWIGEELGTIGEEMKARRRSNELVNQAYAEYLKNLQEEKER